MKLFVHAKPTSSAILHVVDDNNQITEFACSSGDLINMIMSLGQEKSITEVFIMGSLQYTEFFKQKIDETQIKNYNHKVMEVNLIPCHI